MSKPFPILAIETSGDLCSSAVMLNENSFIEVNFLSKHVHSEKLFDMIDFVIKNSKIDLKEFSYIAVSIGPGSFTGLRIGLSAAKGLALGANLPILPVPSLDALALELSSKIERGKEFVILKTASHEDVYYASYLSDTYSYKKIDEVCLIANEEIKRKTLNINNIFGDKEYSPDVKKIFGPSAIFVARWSYLFGKDLLTFDYDFLEPFYLKQFIAKVKK